MGPDPLGGPCRRDFQSKDEGGRHTPFFDNYRPQFYFRTTDVTGVITLPEGTEMCMPGDNVDMKVELITPIAIEKGLRFAIREGGEYTFLFGELALDIPQGDTITIAAFYTDEYGRVGVEPLIPKMEQAVSSDRFACQLTISVELRPVGLEAVPIEAGVGVQQLCSGSGHSDPGSAFVHPVQPHIHTVDEPDQCTHLPDRGWRADSGQARPPAVFPDFRNFLPHPAASLSTQKTGGSEKSAFRFRLIGRSFWPSAPQTTFPRTMSNITLC